LSEHQKRGFCLGSNAKTSSLCDPKFAAIRNAIALFASFLLHAILKGTKKQGNQVSGV